MAKFLSACCLLILLNTPPIASANGCNPEGGQLEINQCALEDFQAADQELNQVWKQLMHKAGTNSDYAKKLRVAQRAWITFRDAEIAAMFACENDNPRYCWGSMYPMLYHIEMAELTEKRTRTLKKYLQQGQNPAVGEQG